MGADGLEQTERRSQRRAKIYNCFAAERSGHETITRAIIEEIVLATAHENDGAFGSCTDCARLIADRWGLAIETYEIKAAIDRLVERGKLIRMSNAVALTQEAADSLADRVRTTTGLEATALHAWENVVEGMYPTLGADHMSRLRDELIACLRDLITDRGLEAAVVLYPEQPQFRHRFEELVALSAPAQEDLEPNFHLVRLDALNAFFDCMIPIQRQWLHSMLTTTYLMNAFTVEPANFDKVRRLIFGQRLYLDTNILFDLLGLHGRWRRAQTQIMLKRARLQGYEIAVTPWTRKEFKQTIKTARIRLKRGLVHQKPQTPQEARDNRTAQAILKAHRGSQRDIPDTPGLELFLDGLEDLEYHLTLEGVEVNSEGCKAVDDETATVEAQLQVLDRYQASVEGRAKSVRMHDIKHRLLIERLRGDQTRRLSNAGYMLVTSDHSLPAYARHPDPDATPFAVAVDAWATRLRQLTPRVEDFDKTLALLLDTPALHVPDLMTNEQITKVLNRLTLQDRFSPEANLRMMLDQTPMTDGEIDPDDYDSAENERTELEIALEAKLVAAREQIAVLQQAMSGLQEEASTAVAELAAAHEQIAVLQRAMDDLQEEASTAAAEPPSGASVLQVEAEIERHLGVRKLAAIICLSVALALAANVFASYISTEGGWVVPSLALVALSVGVGLAKSFNVLWVAIGVVGSLMTIIAEIISIHW